MIYRFNYRGQYKKGREGEVLNVLESRELYLKKLIDEKTLITLSVFKWSRNIFIHYETTESKIIPEQLFPSLEEHLECFAGEYQPKCYVPMYDIFHYSTPKSLEHWERKANYHPYAQIVRLNPDLLSSYIFYHYQLQEERPGCGDKYGMISLHENLLFYYQEDPKVKEASLIPGKLTTNNTPDNWQELMQKHFLMWDDRVYWKKINLIFTVNC